MKLNEILAEDGKDGWWKMTVGKKGASAEVMTDRENGSIGVQDEQVPMPTAHPK